MEIQLVHIHKHHKDIGNSDTKIGNLAILSVPINLQKTRNHDLDNFFDAISQLKSKNISKMATQISLVNFLPRNTDKFYRYTRNDSSCNGISVWTVFKVNNFISFFMQEYISPY